MLFYTMLFLASLAVTLLILWLYKLTVLVGKKVQRARKLRAETSQIPLASGHTHGRNMQAASSLAARNATTNGPLASTWTGKIECRDDYRPRKPTMEASTLNAYLSRKDSEKQSLSGWKRDSRRPIRDDRSYQTRPASDLASTLQANGSKGSVFRKPWGW